MQRDRDSPEVGTPKSEIATHRAMLGLGGNLSGPLGEPRDYIAHALERISAQAGFELHRRSRMYRSAPWGKTDQGDFYNAVAEVHCQLEAEATLKSLLAIESELGRVRSEKWGPRLIDIDLLTYDDLIVKSGSLVLPHPRMHVRAFVLRPLLELDPDFFIPGKGLAKDCLAGLGPSQEVVLAAER